MKYFILVIIIISVTGCKELLIDENTNNKNIKDFETTWQTIDSIYPLLKYKKINWDSIYIVYKPLAASAKGDEIYTVLFNLLKELRDGHAQIQTEGGWSVSTYISPRMEKDKNAYSPLVVRNYFDRELKNAGQGQMDYEFLTPDIGYIYLSTFDEGSWISAFDDILKYFVKTKGLIIDVRNNGGGNGSTTHYILSRFIKSTLIDTAFFKTGINTYQVNPNSSNQYLKPIVILINGISASAAEIFPGLMKYESNVTLIGDTTAGLGGSTYLFTLPSGKKIKTINSYFKSYNNTIIDGNGVAPDIRVVQTELDMKKGVDKQLEYARNYLNGIGK